MCKLLLRLCLDLTNHKLFLWVYSCNLHWLKFTKFIFEWLRPSFVIALVSLPEERTGIVGVSSHPLAHSEGFVVCHKCWRVRWCSVDRLFQGLRIGCGVTTSGSHTWAPAHGSRPKASRSTASRSEVQGHLKSFVSVYRLHRYVPYKPW